MFIMKSIVIVISINTYINTRNHSCSRSDAHVKAFNKVILAYTHTYRNTFIRTHTNSCR